MKKIKYLIAITLLASLAFNSCGIFKKGCNCPHFSKQK